MANEIVPQMTSLPRNAELRSLEDWVLTRQPEEPVPQAKAAKLTEAIYQAEGQLWPASDREIAVALDKLFEFAQTFGMATNEAAARFYRDALAVYPPDLVNMTVLAVINTHKWGMRLPLPSELVAAASDEFRHRRSLLTKLRMASMAKVEDPALPPPTAEDIAKVKAILAPWRRQRGPDPRVA